MEYRSYTLGVMQPVHKMNVRRPDAPLDDRLPLDHIVYWVGYPFASNPIPRPFKMNMLHKARTEMTNSIWDVVELLLSDDRSPYAKVFFRKAQAISSELHDWYEGLPTELRYSLHMPPSAVEFQYVSEDRVFPAAV